MMYCGTQDFLSQQVNCSVTVLFVSGMTSFFGSRRKKEGWLPGTRIILTGQGQNPSLILPAGADWMTPQKKMVVFNISQAVIAGVYYQCRFLPVISRALKIF